MDDPKNSHIDLATKSTNPAIKLLSNDLNFTCNVLQSDSYGWLINNTWDGVMAWFVQKKVDLLYHGTSMRSDRLVHVEFTTDLVEVQ